MIFTPLLLGLVVGLELQAYRHSQEWLAHTNQVISTLDRVLLAVTRAESAQRGFLLTGEERYQSWFMKAEADASAEITDLLTLTTDNPEQHSGSLQLQTAVRDRLAVLNSIANQRRREPLNADSIASMLASGTKIMQTIWDTSRQLSLREQGLLNHRMQYVRNAGIAVAASFVVCILVNLGLLIWAYELIKQYASARERAQQEIMLLNAELEERVVTRTSELELAISELRKSNDDLTKFAYIASHDLQEPLRTVASYVGLLSMRYAGKLDEQADRYIRFAVEGSKRMQNLVHDLLTYSRVGTESLKKTNVEMNHVLRDVRESLDVLFREHQVTLVSGSLPTVYVDEGRITQVFSNLIGNAIKFRKPDVQPKINIDASKQGLEWVFHIADNGIGFDEQYSDRIFAIFQRLHSVGTYPGTGIGLAVCKRIVEQHGGRIWAESVPGEGSTFSFTLPAKLPEPGRDSKAPQISSTMNAEAATR